MSTEPTPLFLVYDGSALEGLVYRIVARCPPRLDDFLSYEVLGQSYDRRDFFRGTGVSMHTSRQRSHAIARRFRKGRGVATLDLRNTPAVWTRAGGRDHITVWAPPEGLLAAVLQCDDHD